MTQKDSQRTCCWLRRGETIPGASLPLTTTRSPALPQKPLPGRAAAGRPESSSQKPGLGTHAPAPLPTARDPGHVPPLPQAPSPAKQNGSIDL